MLQCFNTNKNETHTISLEAKSHKTLNAILPIWDDNKNGLHVFLVALLVTCGVVYSFYELPWYWLMLSGIAAFILAGLVFICITAFMEPKGYKMIHVIQQLQNYPANEQWIVISVDSANLTELKENVFHKKSNAEILVAQCKRRGIGLLLVNKKETRIEVYPKYIKGNFLSQYCIENEILATVKNGAVI